jgi:hypothetical protein
MINSAEELSYNKKFAKKLFGMKLAEAEHLVEREGLVSRVGELDGVSYNLGREVNVRRINLVVRKGQVIDASVG